MASTVSSTPSSTADHEPGVEAFQPAMLHVFGISRTPAESRVRAALKEPPAYTRFGLDEESR